jgi:hypothetical protein
MSDNTYDVNIGAITSTCISGGYGSDTITLDYGTQPSMGHYTMTSGTSTIPYTFTTTGANAIWTNTAPSTVHIDGDGLTMIEGADIKIGGKSLTQAIEKIEERLGILRPNAALEERWETLKDLRRQYMEMEKDLLEKEKIMKILKET